MAKRIKRPLIQEFVQHNEIRGRLIYQDNEWQAWAFSQEQLFMCGRWDKKDEAEEAIIQWHIRHPAHKESGK